MKTSLRAMGNSRGVLIPAAILAATEIHNEIELTVEGGRIILSPPVTIPRQHWFDAYQPEQDEAAWADVVIDTEAEWVW